MSYQKIRRMWKKSGLIQEELAALAQIESGKRNSK